MRGQKAERLQREKGALIDALKRARDDLLAALAEIPPAQIAEACVGEWSAFELLAHLQGWDVTNRQAVEQIAAGRYPSFFQYYDKDWRSYNARLVAQHRQNDFAAQLAAAQGSHAGLLEYLEALPAETVMEGRAQRETGRSVSIHNRLKAEAEDERQHAAQVRSYWTR